MVQQQLELWGGPTFLGSRLASDAASKRARRRPGTGHHANSVEASDKRRPKLKGRALAILAAVRRRGPMTDREIRDEVMGAGFDMNTVRPRITELIRAGELVEVDHRRDPQTGAKVRVVAYAKQSLED